MSPRPLRMLAQPARVLAQPALVALVALAAFLFASAPRVWPEDWDGVGFVKSIARFDMAHFQPHPPGYPVWVAAAKAVATLLPPFPAATMVSIVSGVLVAGLTALALHRVSRHPSRTTSTWLGAAASIVTPLAWRSATVVGTEGLALACAAAAAWGLSMQNTRGSQPQVARGRVGWVVVGVAAGLGLGVRLSWAPLFVGVLVLACVRGARAVTLVAFLATTCAWAVPLVVLVGPKALSALYAVHLRGHATRWGGTALTDPDRARSLARDVFVDGLGVGPDPLGLVLGALLAVVTLRALYVWAKARFVGARYAVIVTLYVAWIAVGQNVRQEPRHAVPVVVALTVALACALSRDRAWSFVACAWLALVALRTADDAWSRWHAPPAAASLVCFMRSAPPGAVAFGTRSARFFELDAADARRGRPAATLGDVHLTLGRLETMPPHVFVTDELDGLERASASLVEVAHPCRPPRLDRRRPCLTIYELHRR